ncbi:putative TetR-family transcriptional regulator [Flavimobilis marinus]|uniref:Transcriptional regulator, TetR family n=1 Tax=Flavimobilis marinus TaxID=285351 RepID=A0A1I2GJB2_9MICO|nr:TetR/AcrR family transcriptional regulator [Flavimobilis marinus]GHG56329.1 putative TetR-family transcriptional regulator [Flavimobilis marinus]SFF17313.1 transcriptional regulator, TetR family [Flavimobilis marinus]
MAYHHGDLRDVLLRAAADVVAADGPEAVTLRGLARQAGVSHAAPAHHFRDRRGLLTALAAEGFRRLTEALRAAPTFLEAAVAYVEFAAGPGRGYYAVMFDATRIDVGDPALEEARSEADRVLAAGVASVAARSPDAPLAALALVHGLVALYEVGALERRYAGQDPAVLTRRIAQVLFTDPGASGE